MSLFWDIEKEQESENFNYDFSAKDSANSKSHYLELKESTALRDNLLEKRLEGAVKVSRKDFLENNSDSYTSEEEEVEEEVSAAERGQLSESSAYESEEEEMAESEEEAGEKSEGEEEVALSRLEEREREEQKLLQSLRMAELNDKEKGQAVKKQLETWDFLLDMRIKMQKGFEKAIALPTLAFGYEELIANDEELCGQAANISASFTELFDDLTSIQLSLLDEEVMPKKDRKRLSKKRSSDEMNGWLTETFEKVIEPMDRALETHRVGVVEKWNEKVQASSGFAMQKKFKVINQSFSTLYSQLNNDKERLMKRTRLNRSNISIIGMPAPEKTENSIDNESSQDKKTGDYNAHIFNDDDFYQQILKEFIDSRISDSSDPSTLGIKYAQLRDLQGKKNKKKVDTRASKGRKIRYHVHEKIQNFMAPEPLIGSWHEEKAVELYASLLGNGAESHFEEKIVTVSDGFKLF